MASEARRCARIAVGDGDGDDLGTSTLVVLPHDTDLRRASDLSIPLTSNDLRGRFEGPCSFSFSGCGAAAPTSVAALPVRERRVDGMTRLVDSGKREALKQEPSNPYRTVGTLSTVYGVGMIASYYGTYRTVPVPYLR